MEQRHEFIFRDYICSTCRGIVSNEEFAALQGVCRCGRDLFDLRIQVRTHYKQERPAESAGALTPLVTGAMGRVGQGINAIAASAASAASAAKETIEEREYALYNIAGATILDLMKGTPEQIFESLSHIRRESAKAKLHPGQNLCKECGEVFLVGLAGFTTQGFCSKLCKGKFEKKNPDQAVGGPAAAPEALPKGGVIACPKCGKSTKMRPGKKNVCMWCSAPIDAV